MGRTPTVHIPRFTPALAAVALVAASAACANADGPAAPTGVRFALDSSSRVLNARGLERPDALIAVLDDAIERVAPSLGDSPDAAVRNSLGALRAALAARGAGEHAPLEASLAAARAALDRLPPRAADAPERDALRLALDAVQARASTR